MFEFCIEAREAGSDWEKIREQGSQVEEGKV